MFQFRFPDEPPVNVSAPARRLHVIYTPVHRLHHDLHGWQWGPLSTAPVTVRLIACTRSLLLFFFFDRVAYTSFALRDKIISLQLACTRLAFSDLTNFRVASPALDLLFRTYKSISVAARHQRFWTNHRNRQLFGILWKSSLRSFSALTILKISHLQLTFTIADVKWHSRIRWWKLPPALFVGQVGHLFGYPKVIFPQVFRS